jgi:hypothetical protein
VKAARGRRSQPVPAARRPDPEPRQHGQGLRRAGERGAVGVTEARARATSIQATPELLNDPEALARFQAAQGELTGALSRLLAVSENYPQLKSDQNFRDLQAQLEGTENRITVARNRYIESVQPYNGTVRPVPLNLTAMLFGSTPSRTSRSRTRPRSRAARGGLRRAGTSGRRLSASGALRPRRPPEPVRP